MQTESLLIDKARTACESCNWTLGECAAEWTQRWAKGRTDADFCRLLGEELEVTPSRIGHCRRVWGEFGQSRGQWPLLKWSHFRLVGGLSKDAAQDALQWASENGAGIRELSAWVRVVYGGEVLEVEFPPESEESDARRFLGGDDVGNEVNNKANDDDTEGQDSRSDARESQEESDARHFLEPSSIEDRRADRVAPMSHNAPTQSELRASVKQLEAFAVVVQFNWKLLDPVLRGRVVAALKLIHDCTQE